MELQQQEQATTGFLQFGDTVRIEMKGKDGQSLFGAIDQTLVSPQGTAATAEGRPDGHGAWHGCMTKWASDAD